MRQLEREGSIPGRVVLALRPELLAIMLNQYKYSIKCTYKIVSEWYFIFKKSYESSRHFSRPDIFPALAREV